MSNKTNRVSRKGLAKRSPTENLVGQKFNDYFLSMIRNIAEFQKFKEIPLDRVAELV